MGIGMIVKASGLTPGRTKVKTGIGQSYICAHSIRCCLKYKNIRRHHQLDLIKKPERIPAELGFIGLNDINAQFIG